MNAIPLSYIARNLWARKLTTVLTAAGMALVVYVFATVLMLAAGLKETLVATGQPDNVIMIRRGSQTEVQSGIDRPSAAIVETYPEIATGEDGRKLMSKEPVVLINLPKRETGKPVQRRHSRRDARRPGAAAAGAHRRRAHVPARHVGDRRRAAPSRRDFAGPRSARRCASRSATGPSSACSTRGARDSIPRSGATPSSCCRRSGASAFRRSCSGSTTPRASTRSSAGSKPIRGSSSKRSPSSSSTRTSRRRSPSSSPTSAPRSRSSSRSARSSAR